MTEKSTIEQMAELLLKSSLGDVEKKVDEQIDLAFTSYEARLDGLKTMLSSKIEELEAIAQDKPLKINFGTVEQPKHEFVHEKFMTVLNILKSQKRTQKNIMLVGEAGSGKTHLAYSISKALGLEFYPMSVGLQTTKSDLLGFINAHGEYVTSPVRQVFEKGGVLLLDEFDSTHAGVVTIINSLLANGHCSFPDKTVPKNDNFICIVACNTYGRGANIDYVGRNRLDGATLDRFVVVDIGYDKKLEKNLTNNEKWLNVIAQIRKNVQKQGIKMIISPRASMNGADLLDAGFSIEEVLDMCIFKGTDIDTKTKCMQGIYFEDFEGAKKKLEVKYRRDLERRQTYIIRTNEESISSAYTVTALNDIEKDTNNSWYFSHESTAYNFHTGSGWSWQCDGVQSIYFTNKFGDRHISDLNRDYLVKFFQDLERFMANGGVISGNNPESRFIPIVFEFVKKGYRNPWKVIEVKECTKE